jgi:hypothetical protein
MEDKYLLGSKVRIICSNEVGQVIGRAEYLAGQIQYQIRYANAAGQAVEQWWSEDAIEVSE